MLEVENFVCGMNNDYINNELTFNYLNFNKYLYELYKQGINSINILLLISLETTYYEGENLKQIILDLKKLSNNIICNFDGKEIKFKVNKIQIDCGDVLNRHRWIYRFNEEYMLENNLTSEEQIPENVRESIKIRAYEAGKQQGFDWFRKNIEAFNQLFNLNEKLDKMYNLGSGITKFYNGCKDCPSMEYICYEYWLSHPRYKIVEKAVNEIRELKGSILERIFKDESRFFLKRLNKRNEFQAFPEMFRKYSIEYLADEVVKYELTQMDESCIKFYFGPEVRHNIVIRSDKAKKVELIKNHLEHDLIGMSRASCVEIKSKDVI